MTALFVNYENSMTFCLYKNALNKVFDVDSVVELYVTLFNIEVPKAVSLFIVSKYWPLFVAVMAHVPGEANVVDT